MTTVKFDPGYAKHITILSLSTEYFYSELNNIKNFNQKKNKFKLMFPRLKKMVDNNVGFCMGSLLWALYIKSFDEEVQIEGNPCFGSEYDENEAVEELDFALNYYDKLKKDVKYFLGQDYFINPKHIVVLNIYKDFLVLNEGFTKTKTSSDLKLPEKFLIPDKVFIEQIYEKIQEVIQNGNLSDLEDVFSKVLKD